MKIFNNLKCIVLVFLIMFSHVVFAANPPYPFLPSDNVQDPNCTPLDSNCYVLLTSFQNETVTGLDYATSTGILSLTSGYNIPLTASTTAWNSAIGALGGSALLQNGNSFGTTLTLGTNDNQALSFETNGINRLTIDTSGNITATGTITASSFFGNGSNLTGIFSTSTTRGVFSASGPISYSTSTGNFLITQASSTSSGYLSSADFTTFQAKEDVITASTTATYFRGDKTFSTLDTSAVPENGNLYFTNARVNSILSATTSLPNITTLSGLISATNLGSLGTTTIGVWNATPIGDSYITKTGNWTGIFDGQEGTYYLDRANHTGTQLASTILDFGTTTRNLLSSTATGLTYSTSTGIFSLTSGYNIPLTASTTAWNAKVSSQWVTSGVNIYYTGVAVGIGTTTPSNKFVVVGTSTVIGNFNLNGYVLQGSSNGSLFGNTVSNGIYDSNFLGAYAGNGATSTSYSNFLGASAGHSATNASYSNFLGYYAGYSATNANQSNFLGYGTGYSATNANNSNFLGYYAGYSATNAASSIFFGKNSGYSDTVNNTSGNKYSILIGNYTSTGGFSNSISIGQGVANSEIDQLNIGRIIYATKIGSSTSSISSPYASASVGIGTSTPADKLQVYGDIRVGTTGTNGCIKDFGGTGITGVCSSDERLKTNVVDLSDNYLDKMAKLRVISYNWNDTAKDLNKVNTTATNYGLLAQNVEENFPELVTIDSNGYKQVNYSRLPLYLIKSIQELSKKFLSFADSVTTKELKTNKLCVDDICVTKDQFKMMLQNSNVSPVIYQQSVSIPAPVQNPEPVVEQAITTEVVAEIAVPIPVVETAPEPIVVPVVTENQLVQ